MILGMIAVPFEQSIEQTAIEINKVIQNHDVQPMEFLGIYVENFEEEVLMVLTPDHGLSKDDLMEAAYGHCVEIYPDAN